MPRGEKFGPVRPFGSFPRLNPKPFDPRESVFIPDLGVDDSKIRSVSPRKMRLIGAKVYDSATQAIADDAAYHALVFDTEAFDQGDLFASAFNTRLTIPYTGIWLVSAFISYAPNGSGLRRLRLRKNAATVLIEAIYDNLNTVNTTASVAAPFLLTAGDYIEAETRQNSTGNLNILAGEDDNFFSAIFLGAI